jgi:hypothetical protein
MLTTTAILIPYLVRSWLSMIQVVAQRIARTNSEYGHFIKVIRLCEGRHQVHVQFGPYTRDTTFIISRKISLSASLTRYGIPELAHEDGLWVDTLNRVD